LDLHKDQNHSQRASGYGYYHKQVLV
jgi:hypothetical protein